MNEHNLKRLITDKEFLENKIINLLDNKLLLKQSVDIEEIKGHILKSEHNLRFISKIINLKFYDWVVTACYYAAYHAALASILTKGFTSKSHLATLCILIKTFYNKELDKKDIDLFSKFLEYQDLAFYVYSKNQREKASYSTNSIFSKKDIERLRIETILFVNKIKEIIK